jgi:hypothetical protein
VRSAHAILQPNTRFGLIRQLRVREGFRSTGTIGEYTTSGATVNASLISGLHGPQSIAVVSASVPDTSSTWTLLLLALTATFGVRLVLPQPA